MLNADKYTVNENGCWIWNGGKWGSGYGVTTHNGRSIGAHRLSYIQHNGEIPHAMMVRHTCDEPLCVNPKHLILGKDQDNKDDAVQKGRHAHGSRHGQSKLKESDIPQIRDLIACGLFNNSTIGRFYGVRGNTISAISLGILWKHVK